MKHFKLKALSFSVLLASSSCFTFSYAANMSNQQIQAMVEKIVNQRTAQLQTEVNQLQSQVKNLKGQLVAAKQHPMMIPTKANMVHQGADHHEPSHSHHFLNQKVALKYKEVHTPTYKSEIASIDKKRPIHEDHLTMMHPSVLNANNFLSGFYLGGTPVFSSPFIGEHSAFDGSNLVVNQPTINFGVNLLRQRQALETAMLSKSYPLPQHPIVQLSGEIEGLGNAVNTHPGNTRSDINLSDAELDVYVQTNPWVLAFLEFSWDDSFDGLYRAANSNAVIQKAFITFGNFNKSPYYATLGQLYVPFGRYSTYMISDPLPKILGRTFARTVIAGFQPQNNNGVFASTYIFRSDTSERAKGVDGGVNLGYKFDHGDQSANIATGLIANIADSQGMQLNSAPRSIPFGGFGSARGSEQIYKPVPAVDINASYTIGNYTLLGEYIDSTTAFDRRALTFNGRDARVSAGHIEFAYRFILHDKPGSFAVSYGFSRDALALLLPEQRYLATINYSFWRDTLASLEFRHDINYSENDRATGSGSAPFAPLNKYVNMVTAQFAVFF